jgi:hypothetical protein
MIVCIWIMLCGRPVAMLDVVRRLESLETFADKIMREAGRYSPIRASVGYPLLKLEFKSK